MCYLNRVAVDELSVLSQAAAVRGVKFLERGGGPSSVKEGTPQTLIVI